MNYSIVIISKDRPAVLTETLASMERQSILPQTVVLVIDSERDFIERAFIFPVKVIFSNESSARKRNTGFAACPHDSELIMFFDDDVELENRYAETAITFFLDRTDVVAASGTTRLDRWIPREQAIAMLADQQLPARSFRSTGAHWVLYGCNMIIRREPFEKELFDVVLPAYSYAEDYELSVRLRRRGLVGRISNCLLIHLKAPQGRLDRDRYVYSVIANNWYFIGRRSVHLPVPLAYVRFFWIILRSVYKEAKTKKTAQNAGSTSGVRGAARAVGDLFTGRLHPSRLNPKKTIKEASKSVVGQEL